MELPVSLSPGLPHCVLLLLSSDLHGWTATFITLGRDALVHSSLPAVPGDTSIWEPQVQRRRMRRLLLDCSVHSLHALAHHLPGKTCSSPGWRLPWHREEERQVLALLGVCWRGSVSPNLQQAQQKLLSHPSTVCFPAPSAPLVLFSQFELATIFMTSSLVNVATLRRFPNILQS